MFDLVGNLASSLILLRNQVLAELIVLTDKDTHRLHIIRVCLSGAERF